MSTSKTKEPAIRLYYVRAYNEDGVNIDLWVRAADVLEAEATWRTHFDLVDCGSPDLRPRWVSAVPDAPARGAIPWSSIHQE